MNPSNGVQGDSGQGVLGYDVTLDDDEGDVIIIVPQ